MSEEPNSKKTIRTLLVSFTIIIVITLSGIGVFFAYESYQAIQKDLLHLKSSESQVFSNIDSYVEKQVDTAISTKQAIFDNIISQIEDELAFAKSSKERLRAENYQFWLEYTSIYWKITHNKENTELLLKILQEKYESIGVEKNQNLLKAISADLSTLAELPSQSELNSSLDAVYKSIHEKIITADDTPPTSTADSAEHSIKEWGFWKQEISNFFSWIWAGFSTDTSSVYDRDADSLATKLHLLQIKVAILEGKFSSAKSLTMALESSSLKRYPDYDSKHFTDLLAIITQYETTSLSVDSFVDNE